MYKTARRKNIYLPLLNISTCGYFCIVLILSKCEQNAYGKALSRRLTSMIKTLNENRVRITGLVKIATLNTFYAVYLLRSERMHIILFVFPLGTK